MANNADAGIGLCPERRARCATHLGILVNELRERNARLSCYGLAVFGTISGYEVEGVAVTDHAWLCGEGRRDAVSSWARRSRQGNSATC
jgi:hypothetical protein